jgi:hypothetical protein
MAGRVYGGKIGFLIGVRSGRIEGRMKKCISGWLMDIRKHRGVEPWLAKKLVGMMNPREEKKNDGGMEGLVE